MMLFGTLAIPLYSLILAHANDHLDRDQMLGASAKLILLYGAGAIVGPSLAGLFMQMLGTMGFMTYMIAVYGILTGFAIWRRLQRPENIKTSAGDVMKVCPVTTPVAAG